MKPFIFTLAFIIVSLFTSATSAQNFQGQAFYMSKTSLEGAMQIESTSMTEEMKKKLMESMKKAFEKSYILTFDKTESIYEEEQKLNSPSPSDGDGMMIKMENSDDGKVYKNLKDKVSITETDFFGKEFLVKDSLSIFNWKLESDSKKIGDYTCYKATYVIPVTENDKQEFEDFKKKQLDNKTQFMIMDEPKERIITVWYTPEIPVSNGPAEYWGLPGLILEANFDKTVVLCSKIILNPKDKLTIKTPNKGKKVSKAEYESIIKEQMEQMNNQNQNGDKNAVRIEIHR